MRREQLVLTIDLEWFYGGDDSGVLAGGRNMSLRDRIAYDAGHLRIATDKILQVLERYGQHITFFCVAEIDEAYPDVLSNIRARGHEIALHSFRHDRITRLKDMEAEFERCDPFKEKYAVVSYRAPFISIEKATYGLLRRYGYKYDSSVYGTTPFEYDGIGIYPVSVLPYAQAVINDIPRELDMRLLKQSVPFGSGLSVAALGSTLPFFIKRFALHYKRPPCVFIHSWQVIQAYCPIKTKMRNPWMFLYGKGLHQSLQNFCERYDLLRFKDCFP